VYSVTQAFLTAIATSHRIATRAELWSGIGGTKFPVALNVISGSVSIDRTAQVRRQCSVSLIDPTGRLVPQAAGDQLAPYGNELILYRGVTYGNGSTELPPLGVFRIAKSTVADDGTGPVITIQGYDRSRTVSRAGFQDVYAIAAGTNVATAIQTLLSSVVSGLTFNMVTTTVTTPAITYTEDDDPWARAQDLAASIGCELFFDVNGIVTMRPQPIPTKQSSVDTFAEGGKLLEIQNEFDDDKGYNGVILTSQVSGVTTGAIRSVQWDVNSNSPTYYLGPYGRVPQHVNTQLATTQAQADTMAQGILQSSVGVLQTVSIAGLVNPALDASDVIQVTRSALGVNTYYVLESFSVPMDAATSMSAVTRKQVSTS